MKKNKVRILIVGGTGFIGYHLAKKCLNLGWSVIIFAIHKPKRIRKLNRVKYLVGNLHNKETIKKINLESNMKNNELVDMLLLQGDAIQILIEKVEKLESGVDYLKKRLTERLRELEERADSKDDEISYIHWNFEPT